ncbi:MAG: squalene/phytoene synthase family protein, partial [Deltaproteobacteria bacterium]|nr:squalene/phytoene synthase family protein [Deltaproteobacteria bacterium]
MEAHGLLSETEHSSLYDQTYCARIVRASGSNFRAAFWCLSRAQRRGLNAVYAFCRFADDVVDSDAAETAKRQALDTWRNAVTDPAAAPHPI